MPVPPPTFTKSKWLSFFAEITAKISHHNPTVVVEGCEILRRLLVTRVSVTAFLEEGNLSLHLLDTTAGILSCDPSVASLATQDGEALFSLFQCISTFVDMIMSLNLDTDEYVSLLVLEKACGILQFLNRALSAKNHDYFGLCCELLRRLLTLPLMQSRRPLNVAEGAVVTRHIQTLEENVKSIPSILRELVEVSETQSIVCSGVQGLAGQAICFKAASVLKNGGEESIKFPELSFPQLSPDIVNQTYQKVTAAECHHDVLRVVDDLWCCYSINYDVVVAASEDKNAGVFERFLSVAPMSSADAVLFRSILSWFGKLCMRHAIPITLRRFLLHTSSEHLLPILASQRKSSNYSPLQPILPNDSRSTILGSNSSSAQGILTSTELTGGGSGTGGVRLEKPSVGLSIWSFFLHIDNIVASCHVEDWIVKGILTEIENAVRQAQSVTSTLIDAPSTVDGTLPDEAYLSCALHSCRTETTSIAIAALRMVSSLCTTHAEPLREKFTSEFIALAQLMIPLCLRIAINNPTMCSGGQGASILHYTSQCPRAARPLSIGECAIIASDSCFCLLGELQSTCVTLTEVIEYIPALARATRNSLNPTLRTTVYRLLVRCCVTAADVVLLLKEMPSVLPASITAVLQPIAASSSSSSSAEIRSMEAAAAAEWVQHVLRFCSEDSSLADAIQIGHSALPAQLLRVISESPISYPTQAFLSLLCDVAEQQKHEEKRGRTGQSALAPYGGKSLPMWEKLILLSTSTNQRLAKILRKVSPLQAVSSDGASRAIASCEELAVQFGYAAALFRGLRLLWTFFPELHPRFNPKVIEELCTAFVSLPSPAEIGVCICSHFGADVAHPIVLQRCFEDALQEAGEMMQCWFSSNSTLVFPALDDAFCVGLYRQASCETLSQLARHSVAVILAAILRLDHQQSLIESIATHSKQLFEACTSLRESPTTNASCCLLIAIFPEANFYAGTIGWICERIRDLQAHLSKLKIVKNFNAEQMEKFVTTLSLVTSAISCESSSYELPRADCAVLGDTLCHFLHIPCVRQHTLKALKNFSTTSEGRKVLLLECSDLDCQHRSCFSKLVHITFQSLNVQTILQSQDIQTSIDCISGAVATGGDSFALNLVKLKALDTVENWLSALDKARVRAPVPLYRFIAASSLCPEVQWIIVRKPSIMTLVIETAEASSDALGTLALLIIRNCCFNQQCKMQLCQDDRVLVLLRNALLSVPTTREEMAKKRSLGSSYSDDLNIFRRKELASTALWALVYNNQRGKSYVRSALKQHPQDPVTMEKLETEVDKVNLAALPNFKDEMCECIRALRGLGFD